ncbi:MAG TPA: ABC transporter ATP-binding protein [Acidimicrobiia bacterium]|jgi:putative ABC transport system ATP-binding protein|nr:ABC transporter ATP-binding protein [Acidimicrobiia bacterium]
MTATLPEVDATADGHDVVLSMDRVVKEYPTTPPVRALAGVSFVIDRGELVSVVGPSGSGKSTLLHIMGTLDRPSSGEVTVAGHRVSDLNDKDLSALRARHIGFVFQQFHLLSGYTALDNVADGLLYTGMALADRRALADRALRRVGLGHRLDHVATKLSGGERQRVAIARALVGEPDIVLADEPTGNLDSKTSDAIVALIEELNAEGATIVVITHNHEIADHFPRKISLRDGRIEDDAAVVR